MRRSLGEKRREITPAQIEQITAVYEAFAEGEHSKIFATRDFGYRKITVERPLRLNFEASAERIARLTEEKAFQSLAVPARGKNGAAADGAAQQQAILAMLAGLSPTRFTDRPAFERALDEAARRAGLRLAAPVRKSILSALSERDETATVCRDAQGNPEPDPELRDYENVPLAQDVEAYFERKVRPHVPDAWVNTRVRDEQDGGVGRVGYEINFNRYFYTYQPPRPLEEIDAEIKALEAEILDILREVAR